MKTFIVSAIVFIGFSWILVSGINAQEKVECVKWAEYAKEFPDFFLTGWQEQQCKAHGMEIKFVPVYTAHSTEVYAKH